MPPASVRDRAMHITRSIAAIQGYWRDKTFRDFEASEPMRAATERHLLIISEAVRHIPADVTDAHPQIPWRDIAGIGNILRHGYDIIDPQRIWGVVTDDLAALKTAVAAILERYPA